MKKNYRLYQWHLFNARGMYFVFVSDKLNLYQVDKDTFKELEQMKNNQGHQNFFEQNGDELLNELVKEGMVACIEEEQANNSSKKNQQESISAEVLGNCEEPQLTNIVLELANDCNLNCKYCYGDGGSYGRERGLMTYETAIQGIEFFLEKSGDLKDLLVTFFGGEPLMNFKVLKEITEYCKKRGQETNKTFWFSMTTNGTILNEEILNHIKEKNISVMISMDGPQCVHDNYRCFVNGEGSYQKILPNMKRLLDIKNGKLSVRSTICKPNMDLSYISNSLLGLGFTTVNLCNVDTDESSDLFIGKEQIAELSENYWRLSDDYVEKVKAQKPFGNAVIDSMLRDLYFKQTRLNACNAGVTGIAIDTKGSIYPCHRFMGEKEFLMGDVYSGITTEISNQFMESSILTKASCSECWARLLCKGACSHTCYKQTGMINKAPECYCELYKGMFEIILYIYWELKNWDDDIFRKRLERVSEAASTIK